MIRGLYSAAAGLRAGQERFEAISQNLVNATTPGYRRQVAVTRPFAQLLIHRLGGNEETGLASSSYVGRLGTGAMVQELALDLRAGRPESTGEATHFLIEGEGYFVTRGESGDSYSRRGDFRLDEAGYLVAANGDLVVGADGRPVQAVDGKVSAGQLLVVQPDPADLVATGQGRYRLREGAALPQQVAAGVAIGYLESSNVDPNQEMTEMLTAFRAYEANQKVIQAMDETLGKAVNEIGRI
ncbi:MAG: flagellar hook-basal body protein [Bacillota bacterium]